MAPRSLQKFRGQDADFSAYCTEQGIDRWSQITERTVRAYGKWLRQERGNRQGTVHDKLTRVLSVVCRLIRTGDLPESSKVRMKLTKPEAKETYCYTTEQVAALIRAAESHGLPYMVGIIAFLAGTGVRVGEALALRWEDVDLDGSHATIRHDAPSGRRTKSGRSRTVHLNADLVEMMRSWPRDDDLLFRGPRGGRLRNRHVLEKLQQILIPAVIKADEAAIPGLERGIVHGFRHYFVSQCVLHNMPIPYIQRQIGHSDSKIIERYIHFYRGEAVNS